MTVIGGYGGYCQSVSYRVTIDESGEGDIFDPDMLKKWENTRKILVFEIY